MKIFIISLLLSVNALAQVPTCYNQPQVSEDSPYIVGFEGNLAATHSKSIKEDLIANKLILAADQIIQFPDFLGLSLEINKEYASSLENVDESIVEIINAIGVRYQLESIIECNGHVSSNPRAGGGN